MVLAEVVEEHVFREARSPVTLRNYTVALRRWAAAGVRAVADVSVEAAQRFVEERLGRVKLQSCATDYSALLAVLAHLERTGRVPAELLDGLRRCAPRPPKRRQLCAPWLTREQVERFCAAADEPTAFLVRLACFTGLRASELARLEWCDVDLQGRVLDVHRGKTGARRVPLCAPAVELLRARAGDGVIFGGVGARTLQAWVHAQPSSVRVTLTLCRHTRASWWVQAGVPIAKVAAFLGHSVEVCARHYAGLAEGYDPIVEKGAAG